MTKETRDEILHDAAVELTRMQRIIAALLRRIDAAEDGGKAAADPAWKNPVQVEEERSRESGVGSQEPGVGSQES